MIINGLNKPKIGSVKISNFNCKHCGVSSKHLITVLGRYVHFFWIPTFPAGRIITSECSNCKTTTKKKNFSPQLNRLYNLHKGKVKRPIFHWSGTIAFVSIFLLFILTIDSSEKDYRKDLLNKDLLLISSSPLANHDTLGNQIKLNVEAFFEQQGKSINASYLTKTKDDRVLVILKVPSIKRIKKENRLKLLNIINTTLDSNEALRNKLHYIGIKGIIFYKVIETPYGIKKGKIVTRDLLYEFYGKINQKKLKEIDS